MQVWIEGSGFGDAEVYVDGLMSHRLVDVDRSFDSKGERFRLVDDATGRTLGYVSRTDAEAQVVELLGGPR